MDTLPSREPPAGGSRSALAVSGFRLRARLGVSIPPAVSGQRGITPTFGYGDPHPITGGTSTLLSGALLSTHYGLDDYVFFAANPRFQEGLLEAEYFQGDARFRGMELAMDFAVRPSLWLNMGMEMVQSKLKAIGTPPPRIPPLRATFGLDYHLDRLRIRPQIVVADARNDVYSGESPTPGYGLVNLAASYTIPREHSSHRLAFNLFNLGNRLYRNHASLIKNLVPEMGRGIRFSYALEFVRLPRSRVSFFDPTPNQTGPGRKSGPDR